MKESKEGQQWRRLLGRKGCWPSCGQPYLECNLRNSGSQFSLTFWPAFGNLLSMLLSVCYVDTSVHFLDAKVEKEGQKNSGTIYFVIP